MAEYMSSEYVSFLVRLSLGTVYHYIGPGVQTQTTKPGYFVRFKIFEFRSLTSFLGMSRGSIDSLANMW